MEQIEMLKHVDAQGRIVLPKKWRDKHLKDHSVVMLVKDGEIIVKANEPEDISDLIDSVELNIKSDLGDWDEVRKELYDIGQRERRM